MSTSLQQVLKKYRESSFSESDKGERFERLMQSYLKSDPAYSHLHKVLMWSEFADQLAVSERDTGIDLVAVTDDGDYWAIQCKCYRENTTMSKETVDSFLSTSGREFRLKEAKKIKFSNRLWISTSNTWSVNAEEAFRDQSPQVTRITLDKLEQAPVNWGLIEQGIHGKQARAVSRELRPHQEEALNKAHHYFKQNDRGKLIMACGTGKTFTSLRIAEKETNNKGLVLFLVPSISLLGQTLREWINYALEPISAICICSDSEVSKQKTKNEDSDGFNIIDLALPASTNEKEIDAQFKRIKNQNKKKGMTVVFSTYQSIERISKVQKANPEIGAFDLIVCDEAHRTTGASISRQDESAFTKVHDKNFIHAHKRIYMTATPRLYSDEAKSKAAQQEYILCSMDDPKIYGEEIYRIGFGESVDRKLLTDYKVLILAIMERDIPSDVQKIIASKENEIKTNDASKLIGCVSALSKQILGEEGKTINDADPAPMRRAVAFCSSIADSKLITKTYNEAAGVYINSLPKEQGSQMVNLKSKHVDGTMSAIVRDEGLRWLKENSSDNECRLLTNVRCLSEGVDVPSLDAVIFLSARNSEIDVVQSVGRVMRISEGKKYGYIIIPVVVPANTEASKVLDNNENYRVVWSVLNALRAHDDRFNATINKIELNKNKPNNILIGRPARADDDGSWVASETSTGYAKQLEIQFQELKSMIYAKMVLKVGNKRYWENWAKDVASIAQRQIERITNLVEKNPRYQQVFDNFLKGLHKNINPSVSQSEAIEMLSQHIITRPVFDALFENYSFVKNNPVSQSMQSMLDILEEQSFEKETRPLEKFYESVKTRASGIDNAEGKQRIIIELYEKFFKTTFPKVLERLGIAYTPVEVVDFIIHSVNDILIKEFGRTVSDENVHLLDPFAGTGTFIVRLLQSGLIHKKDLLRKYKNEIHANEILLLAYYLAAVNIENAFHDLAGKDSSYMPFEGICLTDTFQLGESQDGEKLFSEMFPQNSKRVQRQQKAPLRVIMGNPPYSIGQKSANDDAANQSYPKLDSRIADAYAKQSTAGLNKSLYDAYIKAFRWSTDRLDKTGGIICFVSNGGWIDGNSTDGFRKTLEKEFTAIYVFNLRGNARASGELRQKEGGGVFGGGSRTPIAITLLVKKPEIKTDKAIIYYHDIGDYLDRKDKLKIISDFKTFANENLPLKLLQPDERGDWISMRNERFLKYFNIGDKNEESETSIFNPIYSMGLATARDAWVYNFSLEILKSNIKKTIAHYNDQRLLITKNQQPEPIKDAVLGNWTRDWLNHLKKNNTIVEDNAEYRKALYRPFTKVNSYFADNLNQERYQMPKLFPAPALNNILICVSGVGTTKEFSTLITKAVPDLQLLANAQCFPLYYYEKKDVPKMDFYDGVEQQDYIRRDAVSDFILDKAKKQYGENVTKEDIFYYVYGFLHSKEYRATFANDFKKMLPRLPLLKEAKDFWAFSKAGRALAELHLNYESVPPFEGAEVVYTPLTISETMKSLSQGEIKYADYEVQKMQFPKKDQKDTIIYNSRISVCKIPLKAYEYVVNGKSAIEWVMERYQKTVHKESRIVNNPNDWAKETGNPKYILDLLLSIINVSVQTAEIVERLPKAEFE